MKKVADLLKSQITKLEDKDFDLNTWKTTTVLILQRLFGSTDPKIQQIENLHFDYSSWTLRDSSGKGSAIDKAKSQGKEILELALAELELFGLDEQLQSSIVNQKDSKEVISILEDELKVSHMREIKEILNSSLIESDKHKKLVSALKNFGPEIASNIGASIILNLTDHFID